MAYDADPSATHNPSTGGTPSVAWGDLLNANFAEIGAAWTSFTPTWTASTTNPTIGNGTLTGAYKQLGKLLFVSYSIVFGSTTNAGSGTYSLALPNSLTSAARKQIIPAYILDSGTMHYVGMAKMSASSTTFNMLVDGANFVAHNSPITWATSDEITVEGVLEVA